MEKKARCISELHHPHPLPQDIVQKRNQNMTYVQHE